MSLAKRLLSVFVALPGVFFVVMGLRWLVDPEGIAPSLGLTLETGFGLSTQIGNLSAFFLVAGLSILLAVVTRRHVWFYPAAILMTLVALGRIVAWVAHGAALMPKAILFEVVIALLLLLAAHCLPEKD